MQSRIIISPIIGEAIHIDTVKLSHYYRAADLPPPDMLSALNFDTNTKARGHNIITTAYSKKIDSKSNEPHISIVRSSDKDAYSGINVECSLAKLVSGNGLGNQSQEDIECGLFAIEDYVRNYIGVEFNTLTAKVSRLDVNADFRVGEGRISLFLESISRPNARLTPGTVGASASTNYYFNKSRKYSIYGKKNEMEKRLKEKRATPDDVLAADGLLRVEIRLSNPQSVRRFADKLSRNTMASCLLKKTVAHELISNTISELRLDKPRVSLEARPHLLIQHFEKNATDMLGLLIYRDLLGEDCWKQLGWNKQTYDRKRRYLEAANLWNVSPAGFAHKVENMPICCVGTISTAHHLGADGDFLCKPSPAEALPALALPES